MQPIFPLDKNKLKQFNLLRYNFEPPTWTLIESVLKKSKIKRMVHFELVWGITTKELTKHKNGSKMLAARFWHIFYDYDLLTQIYSKSKKKDKFTARKVKISDKNKKLANELQSARG